MGLYCRLYDSHEKNIKTNRFFVVVISEKFLGGKELAPSSRKKQRRKNDETLHVLFSSQHTRVLGCGSTASDRKAFARKSLGLSGDRLGVIDRTAVMEEVVALFGVNECF